MKRRDFLKRPAIAAAGLLSAIPFCGAQGPTTMTGFRMPEEAEPHARTWMAFGAAGSIWGQALLPEVRQNLATIANVISRYEPVTMLVRKREVDLARSMLEPAVELRVAAMNDLWIRDTGPTFVFDQSGRKHALNFNFNGWGEKQAYGRDAKLASLIATAANAQVVSSDLVLEGGCFEVDGNGTAILTESCVLNDNRNPRVSKAQFEDRLMPLLGLDKIIWLGGIRGRDITDGHTDFYARFARPGLVLAGYDPDPESYDHEVTLSHLETLRAARDASGRALDIRTLVAPINGRDSDLNDDFAAGYVGYYVCNNAVVMQQFGDAHADEAARRILHDVFPGRTIEQVAIDGIAAGGGSIHCATQQEPAA